MTAEQKSQFKSLFLEAWNNVEVSSTELHTYLTSKAHEAGILAPNVELTKEAVRASYATMKDGDYTNYRTRPRKAKTEFVVDFGVDPGDEQEEVEVEQIIQIGTEETLIPQDEVIGDEDELDSEVVEEPETETVMEETTETVKSNFNW
jgi:hypothetical protein